MNRSLFSFISCGQIPTRSLHLSIIHDIFTLGYKSTQFCGLTMTKEEVKLVDNVRTMRNNASLKRRRVQASLRNTEEGNPLRGCGSQQTRNNDASKDGDIKREMSLSVVRDDKSLIKKTKEKEEEHIQHIKSELHPFLSTAAAPGAGVEAKAEAKMEVKAEAKSKAKAETASGIKGKAVRRKRKIMAKDEPLAIEDIEEAPTRPGTLPSYDEAHDILEALKHHFSWKGPPPPAVNEGRSVLDAVIRTILSQATTGHNSTRSFAALKRAYPKWSDALRAGPPGIADAIKVGGLSGPKSRVIANILDRARTDDYNSNNDEPSLEYVRKMDDDTARAELLSFPGVGPKTAACVLMFTLRRPEFPVDTHVHRVTRRLGWVPSNISPTRTYEILNRALPDDAKHGLHVLFFSLGRAICKPRAPRCSLCPIKSLCATGRDVSARQDANAESNGDSEDDESGVGN